MFCLRASLSGGVWPEAGRVCVVRVVLMDREVRVRVLVAMTSSIRDRVIAGHAPAEAGAAPGALPVLNGLRHYGRFLQPVKSSGAPNKMTVFLGYLILAIGDTCHRSFFAAASRRLLGRNCYSAGFGIGLSAQVSPHQDAEVTG